MSILVGVLFHPTRADAVHVAKRAAQVLEQHGARTQLLAARDDPALTAALPNWQLVVTCGGDGTILRVTRWAAPLGIPVLGINVGRLGFLAELKPDDMVEKLPIYINGERWVEERSMLRCDFQPLNAATGNHSDAQQFDALNEVLLTRGVLPRVVRIKVAVDGKDYATYGGDGVLVATATGSTAYSLSAGGPVLSPCLRDLVLTPVCPHAARGTPLVLPAESRIRLEMLAGYPGVLSIDGQADLQLAEGDVVEVYTSPHVARFVRSRSDGYFYELVGRVLR
ncbi:MAG: NAD(+)/NADH kinase [Chloroflexota bacterium]